MKTAGKWIVGIGAALFVLIMAIQAAAPSAANRLAIPMFLLLLIGAGLWIAGRAIDRKKAPTAGR